MEWVGLEAMTQEKDVKTFSHLIVIVLVFLHQQFLSVSVTFHRLPVLWREHT